MSAEEWIHTLTTEPTKENLNKLIDAYNNRAVTAETFYKVVDALLADNHAETRELGLQALAQEPSVTSFIMLSEIASDTKGDSAFRAKAEEQLTKYASIRQLGVLHSILDGSDNPNATIAAAKDLEELIKSVSNPQTPPNGNPPSAPPPIVTGKQIGRAHV